MRVQNIKFNLNEFIENIKNTFDYLVEEKNLILDINSINNMIKMNVSSIFRRKFNDELDLLRILNLIDLLMI